MVPCVLITRMYSSSIFESQFKLLSVIACLVSDFYRDLVPTSCKILESKFFKPISAEFFAVPASAFAPALSFDSVDSLGSTASFGGSFAEPTNIKIRKEFPESWIWDTIGSRLVGFKNIPLVNATCVGLECSQ